MPDKVKSFTLTELLVVMIITAIVAGIAFTVLRLVQQQVHIIGENFEKSGKLSLFEQRLWQDFNEYRAVKFDKANKILSCASEIDTVVYTFSDGFALRNADTIRLKLVINKVWFEGKEPRQQNIDAISISATAELPDYNLFISKRNDAALFMDTDGI